jgi:hypothetical protein
MKKKNFEGFVGLRLDIETQRRAEKLCRIVLEEDNFSKYENLSHFVRCAVIKQIREEEARLFQKKIKKK